jgi:hypothetical protein
MTTSPPTREGDLMELVRGADPLEQHTNPATDEAAELLLAEILSAPRPERSPRARPSTKVVVRLAAAGGRCRGCCRSDHRHHWRRQARSPASARPACARRRRPAPGTILHVDMRGTQNNGDGTTITWRDQSWQGRCPYDRRQVETSPDGTTVEAGTWATASSVRDLRQQHDRRQRIDAHSAQARSGPAETTGSPGPGENT